jgi:hypothetical protein
MPSVRLAAALALALAAPAAADATIPTPPGISDARIAACAVRLARARDELGRRDPFFRAAEVRRMRWQSLEGCDQDPPAGACKRQGGDREGVELGLEIEHASELYAGLEMVRGSSDGVWGPSGGTRNPRHTDRAHVTLDLSRCRCPGSRRCSSG